MALPPTPDYFGPSKTPPLSGVRARGIGEAPTKSLRAAESETTRAEAESAISPQGTESSTDVLEAPIDTSDEVYKPRKARRIIQRATVIE